MDFVGNFRYFFGDFVEVFQKNLGRILKKTFRICLTFKNLQIKSILHPKDSHETLGNVRKLRNADFGYFDPSPPLRNAKPYKFPV